LGSNNRIVNVRRPIKSRVCIQLNCQLYYNCSKQAHGISDVLSELQKLIRYKLVLPASLYIHSPFIYEASAPPLASILSRSKLQDRKKNPLAVADLFYAG